MDPIRVLVMFLHIGAGIIWIGGLAYVRFVLLPGLGRAAPNVRGPLVADVGPKTVRFLLRYGEVTIVTGLANFFLMDGLVKSRFSMVWGGSIALGLIGAIVIYGIGQAVTRPTTQRIADTVRAVAEGRAGPDAPELLATLANRQRNVLTWQFGIGVVVVLTMAVARFA